jgi:hypothetical protein
MRVTKIGSMPLPYPMMERANQEDQIKKKAPNAYTDTAPEDLLAVTYKKPEYKRPHLIKDSMGNVRLAPESIELLAARRKF